jgi:hypothetical protein
MDLIVPIQIAYQSPGSTSEIWDTYRSNIPSDISEIFNGTVWPKSSSLAPIITKGWGTTESNELKIYKSVRSNNQVGATFPSESTELPLNTYWKLIDNLTNNNNFATDFKYTESIQTNDLRTFEGRIFRAIVSSIGKQPGAGTWENYWEFADYNNKYSFLQNQKLGYTRFFKNAEITFIKPKNCSKLGFLGLENISHIFSTEKPLTGAFFIFNDQLVDATVGAPLGPIPGPITLNTKWTALAYSEKLDILVAMGYIVANNQLTIKYIKDVALNKEFTKSAIQYPVDFVGPQLPSNSVTYPWQIGTLDNSLPIAQVSQYNTIKINKIYWSNLFDCFFALGSDITNDRIIILKSFDGINWIYSQTVDYTPIAYTGGVYRQTGFIDIIDTDDRIIAITEDQIWSSVDGASWQCIFETFSSSAGYKFHQIAYVGDETTIGSTIYNYICIVGDKGVSTEGYAWIFTKSNNYVGDVFLPDKEFSIPRYADIKLSTFYNKQSNELLVGSQNKLYYLLSAKNKTIAEIQALAPLSSQELALDFYLQEVGPGAPPEQYSIADIKYSQGEGLILKLITPLSSVSSQQFNVQNMRIVKTKNTAGTFSFGWDFNRDTLNGSAIGFSPPVYTLIKESLFGTYDVSMAQIKTTGTICVLSKEIGYLEAEYPHNLQSIPVDYTNLQSASSSALSTDGTTTTKVHLYFVLENTEDVAVIKNLIAGTQETLGVTQLNSTLSIIDYSKKSTDEFGNTTFIERGFSERYDVSIIIPETKIPDIYKKLTGIRNTACLWIGAPKPTDFNYTFLTALGYYKDFNINIQYPEYAFCTFSVEGLLQF